MEGRASQESWVEEILQGVIQFPKHHTRGINDIIKTCNGDHSCHSKLIPAPKNWPFYKTSGRKSNFKFIALKNLNKNIVQHASILFLFYLQDLKNLIKNQFN